LLIKVLDSIPQAPQQGELLYFVLALRLSQDSQSNTLLLCENGTTPRGLQLW